MGCPEDGVQAAGMRQLVLIPSYNTGAKLAETVAGALEYWQDVFVVIDGSTDGSGRELARAMGHEKRLRVIRRAENGGKGAAVLDGLRAAAAAGFTHVLVMDADGQHPAAEIPEFFRISQENPEAMVLGVPVFGRDAPYVRRLGRRISNLLVRLETQRDIGDALFGFRVYPLAPLLGVMQAGHRMRGYDFDTEAVVRLAWRGVAAINREAPVRYFSAAEGGVSHFGYVRDNLALAAMHLRLMGTVLGRRKKESSFSEEKEAKRLF